MEIIRPNTKKVEEERKKKKEEKGRNKSPLKHFSGLKNEKEWEQINCNIYKLEKIK